MHGTLQNVCLMLTQLQRDLASVVGQQDSAMDQPVAPPLTSSKARSSASSSYEMDRFDAANVTLNNRVPPGTRTNNYWDNFRSYSRQNLLSTQIGPGGSQEQQQMAAIPLPTDERPQQQQQQPVRRTKRKINKGQRQVEIGVRHADNRQLAYGLLGVRNVNSDGAVFGSGSSEGGAMGGVISSSDNNKVAKDTSTLKYSGARPKERRAEQPQQQSTFPLPPPVPNVNLLAERKPSEDKTSLEAVVRGALTEVHSGRPQFISQLLDLLHK